MVNVSRATRQDPLRRSRVVTLGGLMKRFLEHEPSLEPERPIPSATQQGKFFLMDEKPLLYQSARPERSREARAKGSFIAPLTRSQSERCRRLAFGRQFRLLRSFGIDLEAIVPGIGYSITPLPKFPDRPVMETRVHFS